MSINPTFNVSVIFGKRDEPMLLACACQLINLIRLKEMWKIPTKNERSLKEMGKIPMELHMLKEMWKILGEKEWKHQNPFKTLTLRIPLTIVHSKKKKIFDCSISEAF